MIDETKLIEWINERIELLGLNSKEMDILEKYDAVGNAIVYISIKKKIKELANESDRKNSNKP